MIGPTCLPPPVDTETIKRVTEDLRAAVETYKAELEAATRKRDDAIRAAHAAGMRPKDIETETGYSRETVRQILMSEDEREAFRARRRKGGDR
jgi:hypothetical protein